MTPERRAAFERLVDAMERENYWCGVADEEGNSERLAKHGPLADAARAALTDFVERLTAGEEAELEHFERRSAGDHITFFFPRETCGHPFRFAGAGVRVTPLDGGTDG